MPSLNIKGIPDSLYRQLKERATEHRRSLNSEVIVCLEQALAVSVPNATAMLAKADALRAKLHVPQLTEARLRASKAAGRP